MDSRLFIVVAVACFAGACASAPQIPLSLKQVQDLNVTGVEIDYTADARIAWSAEEAAYAASMGYTDSGSAASAAQETKKPSYDALINSPQSKQRQKELFTPRLKAAFERALAGRPAGTRSVKVVVVVKEMNASPDAQCAMIGGARVVVGSVRLVDATGTTLATQDNLMGIAQCSGALTAGLLAAAISASQGDPIDIMTEGMAANFKKWLMPAPVPG